MVKNCANVMDVGFTQAIRRRHAEHDRIAALIDGRRWRRKRVRSPAPSRLMRFWSACLPQLRSSPQRLRPEADSCSQQRPKAMASQVICHAIGDPDSFSAGWILKPQSRHSARSAITGRRCSPR